MIKKVLAAAAAAVVAVSLAACASSSSDPEYLSQLNAADYVDLCDYSSIPVEEAAPSVSDDYRDYYIQYQLTSSATTEKVTDRDDVEDGDIVNIDYTGKIDGKEFDGGSATGYDLTIGSGSFIDGFEDGLIGHKVGETVDLNLKFPDDYSNSDVAGKDVVFTVTINSISTKVTPELTDEWVQGRNIAGVTTVDEYKDYIYNQLLEQAQQTYDSDVQSAVGQYVLDNSTFKKDPPKAMVSRISDSMKTYYTQYATQYGMELDNFLETFMGADKDDPEAIITTNATDSAKELLALQAIADREGLNPSRTEISQEVSSAAVSSGYDSVADFKKATNPDEFKENVMSQNVLKFLASKANVTEPSDDDSSESSTEDSTEASTEASTEESTESSEEATDAAASSTEASTAE